MCFGPTDHQVYSERMNALLERLAESSDTEREKLHKILDRVTQGGVKISSLDDQAQGEFRQLMGIQHDALHAIKQARVIQALHFEGIHQRYEQVAEAHARTFAWITEKRRAIVNERAAVLTETQTECRSREDDSSIAGDEDGNGGTEDGLERGYCKRQNAKRLLWDWVASPGGILHISGKLGSGKSTLMKFRVDSKGLPAGLKEWAGK